MTLSGDLFIGNERRFTTARFHAVDAATGAALEPGFSVADAVDVADAAALAAAAFDDYRALAPERRARFLEAIADQILALGDALLERCRAETGLPLVRLTGERGRTIGQLRLFADELRHARWHGVRVDAALPERKPLPRPDLRQRRIPLGPVVVFGASNFPLAFSVAGGDTAAALAAGCPVIVKGHPAHPGTSELVAQAIIAAREACGLQPGVFALLNSTAVSLGTELVADPRVKAVGFTGSRAGGLALAKIAAARSEPIPVYAEMSSVNPVVLLPAALESRAEELGTGFIGSLTLGVGQFCTNPGLVIAIDGAALERFIGAAATALATVAPGVMLTRGIHAAYTQGLEDLLQHPCVRTLARGAESVPAQAARGALFATTADDLLRHPELLEEVFGPAGLIVRCADVAELVAVLEGIAGQLTATLHLDAADEPLAVRLVPILERKAGRLIANGWPTGVEVAHAMVHGGPFPATSDGRSTSVGTLAIERFLRPVCYQDFPDALLPGVLRRGA
jgi:NADP-dependent aldehyde dehydrogenase